MPTDSPSATRDVRTVLTYLIPTVLSSALPIVLMPFLTKSLSPAEFGLIALAQIFAIIVFAFSHLGLANAYERNYFQASSPQILSELTWTCFSYLFAIGFIVAIAFCFATDVLERLFFHTAVSVEVVGYSVLGTHLRGANEIHYKFLRNGERPKRFVVASVFEVTATFVATFFFVVDSDRGVEGYFMAQALAAGMTAAVSSLAVASVLTPRFGIAQFRSAVKLGSPLTIRALVGLLSGQLDKYLLSLVGSLSAVGLYAVGQRFAQSVLLVMNALDFTFVPKIYRMMFDGEARGREIGRYMTSFVFATCSVCLLVSLFSEEAILILATPEYGDAIWVGALLSLNFAFMIFGKANGRQVMYAKKPVLSLYLGLFGLLVTAAISIPLILQFGLAGGAVGTLLSGAVYAYASNVVSQRCFRVEWETARNASAFGLLITAIVMHLFLLNRGVDYEIRLAVKFVFVIGFIVLGRMLQILPRLKMSYSGGVS